LKLETGYNLVRWRIIAAPTSKASGVSQDVRDGPFLGACR
jgi:hypothetical protein